MLIGYARVSTQDQNLELQREALSKAGCQKIFEDKVSGTRADRPGLGKAQEMLREGDTLVVWKLDRLGRSVKQLVDLVGELHKQNVVFQRLTALNDEPEVFRSVTKNASNADPIAAKSSLYGIIKVAAHAFSMNVERFDVSQFLAVR